MATLFNSSILSNTYKDDYVDSAGYHRILFNSGRPLQARELTQMQTIIQEQIKRFGSNIFKEGGVVKPGERIINTGYEFVKLNVATYGLPTNLTSLNGTTFTGNTSGVTARIIEAVAADGSDPATIYVAYTNAPTSLAGTNTVRFSPNETITNGSITLQVQNTNTDTNPAVGTGTRMSIGTGIYFAKGFFVFTESQSVLVSKYTNDPTGLVGYKVIEDIVTVDDTNKLYDNQGSVPNVSSPGADRLRIRLVLTNQSDLEADDNFIPIVSIIDGAVHKDVNLDNSYNVVRDFVATRIKENSGDYLVKPYRLFFSDDSADGFILANVSDGTAVVDGYRAHNFTPTTIRVEKPTTTHEINNEVVSAGYGQYVLVDASVVGNNKGLPNIESFPELEIQDGATWGAGSKIGTCRVRAVSQDIGDKYRFYIFDIQMIGTRNFRDAQIIGTGSSDYFKPVRTNNKTDLYDVEKNTLLFELPRTRPRSFDDIVLTTQRRIQVSTGPSGTSTVPGLTATGETFANYQDWIIASNDSDIFRGAFVSGNPNGQTSASLTGLPANETNMDLYVYVNKASATPRTKGLEETTITRHDSDGEIPLSKADIFEIVRITENDSDGKDLSSMYRLDNGQRDNYYGLGKMILKEGLTAPTAPVFIRYKYFSHGTTGDFFCINSYTGEVDYDKIPSYRTSSGELVQLRNVIDLRSVQDSAGEFASSVLGARIHELPQVNDTISADITYYIPRRDTLVVDTDGNLFFNKGIPSFAPTRPDHRIGTLPLYDVLFFGNTIDDRDILVTKYDHKRYTMKDIGQIEDRIDRLEEVTSLSLLETETKNFEVLDSAGNNRTKSGFFVDNFSTQLFTDVDAIDYRASIDPQKKYLRPAHHETNIRMIYDSAQSSNVVRRGDNIYLPYENVTYFDQDFASQAIEINPFEATVYHGDIDLSPSSDEWREVNIAAKKAVDGGVKLNTNQAIMWNNWQWNWGGTKIVDLKIGVSDKRVVDTSTAKTTYVNTIVKDEVVKEIIGERVIDITLIPFMRSKKVFFRAQGLRPSSRVWVYFNGVRMDSWIKEETFQYSAAVSKDYGNTQNRATSHPDGNTATLTTDSFGKIEGSMFIPNTPDIRFRTGIAEFKILDVSANNDQFSGTIARALYAATGYLDHIEQTIKSTRVLHVSGSKSVEHKYVPPQDNGGDGHSFGDNNNDGGGWSDPCADGGYDGSGVGSSACFAAGTMFRMADGTLKAIEDIMFGDIMEAGGRVYAVLQGDGINNEWFNYQGIEVTGGHPVYDKDGIWRRVEDALEKQPIKGHPVVYSLMNDNHMMITENGTVFTDFVEIGSEVEGRGEWMMELLNKRDARKIA